MKIFLGMFFSFLLTQAQELVIVKVSNDSAHIQYHSGIALSPKHIMTIASFVRNRKENTQVKLIKGTYVGVKNITYADKDEVSFAVLELELELQTRKWSYVTFEKPFINKSSLIIGFESLQNDTDAVPVFRKFLHVESSKCEDALNSNRLCLMTLETECDSLIEGSFIMNPANKQIYGLIPFSFNPCTNSTLVRYIDFASNRRFFEFSSK